MKRGVDCLASVRMCRVPEGEVRARVAHIYISMSRNVHTTMIATDKCKGRLISKRRSALLMNRLARVR